MSAKKTVSKKSASKKATKKPVVETPAPVVVLEAKETKVKTFAPHEDKIRTVREGTKVAQLISLISRKGGAKLSEIEHIKNPTATVKKFLNYDMRALVGYGYTINGDTVTIILPAGMKTPMAHTPRKGVVETVEAKAA